MVNQNFMSKLLICLGISMTILIGLSSAQSVLSDLDSKYYSQHPSPWLPRPPIATVTPSTRKGRDELTEKSSLSIAPLPEVIISRRSLGDLGDDDDEDEHDFARRGNSKGRSRPRQKGRRGNRRPQKKKARRGNRKPKNGSQKNRQKYQTYQSSLPLPSSHHDFVESQWNQIAKLNKLERQREREMGRGRGKDEKSPGGSSWVAGQSVEKLVGNLKSICSFLLPSLDYKGSLCGGERPVAGRSLEGGLHFGIKG